jgi:mono/diheme cytochrome c family protein
MKRRWPILVIIALGALVIFVWLEGPLVRLSDPLDPSTERQASAERGQYLFRIAGCAGCHTREDGGAYLAGGRALVSPYGTFFSPNITPDPQTGIGNWTSDDFVYTMGSTTSRPSPLPPTDKCASRTPVTFLPTW